MHDHGQCGTVVHWGSVDQLGLLNGSQEDSGFSLSYPSHMPVPRNAAMAEMPPRFQTQRRAELRVCLSEWREPGHARASQRPELVEQGVQAVYTGTCRNQAGLAAPAWRKPTAQRAGSEA